jgi:hypothetical protein
MNSEAREIAIALRDLIEMVTQSGSDPLDRRWEGAQMIMETIRTAEPDWETPDSPASQALDSLCDATLLLGSLDGAEVHHIGIALVVGAMLDDTEGARWARTLGLWILAVAKQFQEGGEN